MSQKKLAFLGALLSYTVVAHTAELSMEQITENVRRVCLAPGDAGKEWAVKAKARGDVSVGLKIAGGVKAEGLADFSRSEWEGVQRVLQEKQQDDNARYRLCAEKLTPVFLDKYGPKPTDTKPLPEQTNSHRQNSSRADQRPNLPVTVTATSERLTLIPGFTVDFLGGDKFDDNPGRVKVRTSENGVVTLTEAIPVDVSFKGQNYKLLANYQKSTGQFLLTLSNKKINCPQIS